MDTLKPTDELRDGQKDNRIALDRLQPDYTDVHTKERWEKQEENEVSLSQCLGAEIHLCRYQPF